MSSDGNDAAAKRSKPRLVLYSGPSKFNLATIHSEYSIDHIDDEKHLAFQWSTTGWYAIALEVDGRRVPFKAGEKLVLKILDERDPHTGVSVVESKVAKDIYTDGMHYYKAIEFLKVGEYRVIIAPHTVRKEWREEGVRPRQLAFEVRVEDPGYEAAQRARITAELPEAIESVRRTYAKQNQYPSAPLTQKEK